MIRNRRLVVCGWYGHTCACVRRRRFRLRRTLSGMQRGNRLEQPLAVAQGGDAQLFQVVIGEVRQHIRRNRLRGKLRGVLFQTHCAEPCGQGLHTASLRGRLNYDSIGFGPLSCRTRWRSRLDVLRQPALAWYRRTTHALCPWPADLKAAFGNASILRCRLTRHSGRGLFNSIFRHRINRRKRWWKRLSCQCA